MSKLNIGLLSIVTILFFLSVSCGESKTSNNETADTVTVQEKEDIQKIAGYPIPTPYETSLLLQKAGAGFVFDLTNSASNSDKYFTEKSKALNLGIYGADLSYSSTYNKAKEVKEYMICSKKMSDDLGIVTDYNSNLLERLEANIENQDSLHKIVSKSYFDTFNHLNENQRGSTALMILTGGWVESLYISTQLAATAMDNTELITSIENQRLTLTTLLPLYETFINNTDIKEISEEIKPLSQAFNKINAENPNFTPEQIKDITQIIEKIRASFVDIN